jgi:hypothetical protein
MQSDLCFVLGGVDLVRNRIRQPGLLAEITLEINPFLVESGFLANAPFKLINAIIRYGRKFDPFAQIGPISRRHNELQLSVEVESASLNRAPREVVKVAFLRALIPGLFAVAKKYDLPTAGLVAYRDQHVPALPAEEE